jgi:hypothetical protein
MRNRLARLVLLSIKVFFNEITYQYDALYYETVDDRYALLSYCTTDERFDWVDTEPRFGPNRVGTLEKFAPPCPGRSSSA